MNAVRIKRAKVGVAIGDMEPVMGQTTKHQRRKLAEEKSGREYHNQRKVEMRKEIADFVKTGWVGYLLSIGEITETEAATMREENVSLSEIVERRS